MKKQLLIIGGGFAGFWSVMSALRQARELKTDKELDITLVNLSNYFTMRPRLYEPTLEGMQVELDRYLKPLGIKQVIGKAELIDPEARFVTINTDHGLRTISYDYLILASGSSLLGINIPGIEHSFNVDQFENAKKLENHLIGLAKKDFTNDGADTIVIVGAGFTGVEAATSIREKMEVIRKKYAHTSKSLRVILVEKSGTLAHQYAGEAQRHIEEKLSSQSIEIILNNTITSIEPDQVTLSDGQTINTSTVIWTVGMTASPLTYFFKGSRDESGRLQVDEYLKLPSYNNVILAGDVARAIVDDEGNESLMACQFSMYQGKWAGHNAVNDLFAKDLKVYKQENYVTCLDLGQEDALLTVGRERQLHLTGKEAKKMKRDINGLWIYPMPDVEETLQASYPEIPNF